MLEKWKDELLESTPKYNIKKADGTVLENNVSLELATTILQEGTPITAGQVNLIIDNINNFDCGEWL